jgi:ribosomal protein S18 acetylase RimI-like enzyme
MVKPEDVSVLQAIARDSYNDTRFYFDPHFPRSLSQLLYQRWIALSCEGYADDVLVAEFNQVPVAYISCHLDQENMSGKIGLVGVSHKARGQGIGKMLVLKALEWFIAHDAQEVSVVTQGRNVGAQRLYQRCGFLTKTVQLWYHKWYILPEGVL